MYLLSKIIRNTKTTYSETALHIFSILGKFEKTSLKPIGWLIYHDLDTQYVGLSVIYY